MKLSWIIELLKAIDENKSHKFLGLGIIFYTNIKSIPVTALKPPPVDINLPISDLDEIIKTILNISNPEHFYHDGFHMINKNGSLTHLSQYFSTPIIANANVEFQYGSRHRTALYGSFIDGIQAVGVCSKNEGPIMYTKGQKHVIST